MKKKTAVAISGGVDSLMAAWFLKDQGQDVIGIHFITGFETALSRTRHAQADSRQKILDIGMQLGIPVEIVDIRAEFQEKIVDYFTQTYKKGQTPNPCMRCNPMIKFGRILSCAHSLGAQKLATGHYARIKKNPSGNFHLFKGLDNCKDQSYFLARLTQQQLKNACFPLGERKKSEIKQMAAQKALRPVTADESQDICFIKGRSYGEFLSAQKEFEPQPGLIENMDGQVIGEHNGLHLFTIGQRRGINCPAAEPYYVIRLDAERNRLTVGAKKDLLSSECKVGEINWIGKEPTAPMDVHTRVRYRSKEAASRVFPQSESTAIVHFNTPQTAVTPGQGAVFYRGDEILGGGWISSDV
ncbi:MAG: tRNA 2-thiouridine(34) synthase MnmA [Desulfobacterales bacterium]